MTKNVNFVSHKKSKVKLENGKPQLPSASALVEGEIAINYAENVETLSIKNESGTVVTFSSDNYYTEQKLGSGFTGANSAKTVTEAFDTLVGSGFTSSSITDVIVENEEIVTTAINGLNENKVNTGRTIATASGLTGGGDLSADRTIGLVATGTSGTYGPSADVTGNEGNTIKIPQITTDVYGRVTSVTERTYTSKNSTYTVNNGTFAVSGNGTSVASTSANASANTGVNIKAGSDISITTGTGEITIAGNYTFDGTYNPNSNKVATVNSVTTRIAAISGSSTGSPSKTITAITQSNGVVTPTYDNISITKSQVSDFAHNQASNTITAMTSYAIASASGAVATSDSLNTAIGKLEKRIAILEAALGGMKLVKLTAAQYEALTTKDSNTLYIISD